MLAWVLVRYEFPAALARHAGGRALRIAHRRRWPRLDSAVCEEWLVRRALGAMGHRGCLRARGHRLRMAFTSIPFVVRTVQPVLEDLSADLEEAATTLGASEWRVFRTVIFPAIFPAFLAGASLAFARSWASSGRWSSLPAISLSHRDCGAAHLHSAGRI